jgi:chromosomal replication initiator protein
MASDSASLAATRRISNALAERIGRHSYEMWFADATRLNVHEKHLEVATNSGFVASWIGNNFRTALDTVAREALGEGALVEVHPVPELFQAEAPASAGASKHPGGGNGAPPRRRPAARRGGALRRLDDFVTGPSNRLAFLAARRLAEDGPEAEGVSPLFVHGECGVGKTHLLQGIARRALDGSRGAGGAARYVTAEQFTNEYIAAVRSGGLDRFRKRLRKLELLAVDDVHFVSNKVATQNELQHTIDAIAMAGSRVVFASDEHPRHLGFPQALASRFVAGMVACIERPDRATRLTLMHRLAGGRGFRLTDAAAEAIASRCVGSVRELEGAANKLAALRLIGQESNDDAVGLMLVEQLFADATWRPRTPVRLTTVMDAVCTRLVVNRAQLLASGRHRRVVTARGLVAYLAREMTTLSYPEIAHALGRKHHSTVHTAVRRVTRELQQRQRVEVGENGDTAPMPELVDHLRHEILKQARSGRGDRLH